MRIISPKCNIGMIESVVTDVGPAASMAVAAMSASSGSSATTIAATAAAAAVVAPCFAEAVWNCKGFRIRRAVPSVPSPLTRNTATMITELRGGASTAVVKKVPSGGDIATSKGDKSLARRGKAVAFMALAMACHYLGK